MNSGQIYYNRWYTQRSLIVIFIFIFLGTLLNYGLNNSFSRAAYFFTIIFFYLRTKDNSLGLALLFILAQNPLVLFYSSPYDLVFRLTPTVGVSYKILFALTIFIKYRFFVSRSKASIPDYIRPFYFVFTIYLFLLISLGLVFGHSARSLFDLMNSFILLSLFLVIPRIFEQEALYRFNKIVFAFSIIHTILSLTDIITNGAIINVLVLGRPTRLPLATDELIRLFGGMGIAFYSFISSLYYMARQNSTFKTSYLWVVAISSWLLVLNSATRGWMIASFFLFGSIYIFYFKRVFTKSRVIVIAIIIAILGYIVLPNQITNNISASFERLSTVESVAEGDLSAGGTSSRWDRRGPYVLTRFEESPVFGFGFSQVTSEYYDPHVGNHTVLLMGGVIGLIILFLTVIIIAFYLFRLERANESYKGIVVIGLALLSILIIHSTNMIMISYVTMPPESVLLIALLFCHVNSHLHYYNRSELSN